MSLVLPTPNISTADVAQKLHAVGDLLAQQEANPFQARAYHRAADTVRGLHGSLRELIERQGQKGLEQLPSIGPAIARAIIELVQTGRLRMLDRLEGEMCPEQLLASIPGVGPTLAKRVHEQLGVSSLEDLELVANDGRLERVRGFGARRVAAIRDLLDATLRRARRYAAVTPRTELPSIARLLAVDARYRAQAERGELTLIKPRRFNPEQLAWLPVLHLSEEGEHVTALFSNTALAHRLGKTRDWVVVYVTGDGCDREHQFTVVTETSGVLRGRRVVRGREVECMDYYAVEPRDARERAGAAMRTLSAGIPLAADSGMRRSHSDHRGSERGAPTLPQPPPPEAQRGPVRPPATNQVPSKDVEGPPLSVEKLRDSRPRVPPR